VLLSGGMDSPVKYHPSCLYILNLGGKNAEEQYLVDSLSGALPLKRLMVTLRWPHK